MEHYYNRRNIDYDSIFPSSWAQKFDLHKDIDETDYNEINDFMRKLNDEADKNKKQNEKKKKERRRRGILIGTTVI